MPLIHESVAPPRIRRIAVLALLICLSGCGRSRSSDESARSVEPESAQADVELEFDDRSNDVEEAPRSESGVGDVTRGAAVKGHAATATAPTPPAALSPAPSTGFSGADPSLERARAKSIARTQSAQTESARARSERADVASGKSKKFRAKQKLSARPPRMNSIGASAAVESTSSEIVAPSPAIGVADSIAAAPPAIEAALSLERDTANETPAKNPEKQSAENSEGFTTVPVYYATDRQHDPTPLSAYELTGNKQVLVFFTVCFALSVVVSAFCGLRGRTRMAAASSLVGCVTGSLAAACVLTGSANIQKRGVTYTGDRGQLIRGICEVTIPKMHRSGIVERPSLFRLEFHEDQQKHIVLTSAVELTEDDFHARLSDSIAQASAPDLLVFIHGYNVDFQSAVRRTAQISVDLPFEGVPVCYTWPSQGTLLGYSVDETNAAWTTTHLKQFLLELVSKTNAKSINVIAHSMGNRPMTAAMEQIGWQQESDAEPLFDRVVLAAPDVDADRFRRDFGPSLSKVANLVTLYASSDDQALIASKKVHGYPRAGESGDHVVVVPGVETIDVSGIDLSLLGHSYYGDNKSMLRDLYEVVRSRLSASQRPSLTTRRQGDLVYWQLALGSSESSVR